MNIVLLGGPGSGKGTVSNLLEKTQNIGLIATCLLYTSPSPRDS